MLVTYFDDSGERGTYLLAGVGPLRVHDLRHSCVALLVAQGAHPLEIKAQLGHSSIQTTLDTYGRLFRGLDERLAEGLEATFQSAHAIRPPTVATMEACQNGVEGSTG
jgi:hypothetical protein